MVYASTSTNSYRVFVVNQNFVDASECHNCTEDAYRGAVAYDLSQSARFDLHVMWTLSRNGSLDRFEPAECLTRYATTLQSDRRNLLLVTEDDQAGLSPPNYNITFSNNTDYFWSSSFSAKSGNDPNVAPDSYDWICTGLDLSYSQHCANEVDRIKRSPGNWTMRAPVPYSREADLTWPISYCLSEKAVSRCRLNFSPAIAAVVTVLNLCKYMVFLLVICTDLCALWFFSPRNKYVFRPKLTDTQLKPRSCGSRYILRRRIHF